MASPMPLAPAVMTVPIGLLLGIGLAVLADKHLRGIGFFRTVFSSTVATSVAVASLVWFVLLQPEIGVLSDLFSDWIPALKNPGLLRDPDTALPAVALSSIWASLGFTFIVITAGLQSVPKELYESAYVDGAGSFRRFTNVTLPMLSCSPPVRCRRTARWRCSPAAARSRRSPPPPSRT